MNTTTTMKREIIQIITQNWDMNAVSSEFFFWWNTILRIKAKFQILFFISILVLVLHGRNFLISKWSDKPDYRVLFAKINSSAKLIKIDQSQKLIPHV